MIRHRLVVQLVLAGALVGVADAQTTTPSQPTEAVTASPTTQPLNVPAAVEAYLAKMSPEQRTRSDSYFEGGYWLLLWDFIATAIVMWLLLRFRWSMRMRNLAERFSRWRPLQTALYWVQFIVLTAALQFPLTVYEGYFREHEYGLLNQTFGPWLRDQLVALTVLTILGALLLIPLFGMVRKLGKSWWIWGATLCVAFLAFVGLIAPVYISPLFNTYRPLADASIKEPILSLARANGIPATEVYEFDASRQSNRVSANVSGFANTLRISLNDNLLRRCTLEEIETTMGHEMGHYVLNHSYKGLVMNGVVVVIGFAFLDWALAFSLGRWGERWGIRDVKDVAVLPLAFLLLSAFFFVTTPIGNTITRSMEFEADMYGLNSARQPDGEANVDLLLGEYRKMSPGPVEEFLFYDHPSGRTRITAAMRWKAEHPETASPAEMARKVFEAR